MKKDKIILSAYQESIHKIGNISFLIVYGFIILYPVVISIVYDAWPNFNDFLTAAIGVVPLYWAVGCVEAFTYMPMLGAGGSYISFITGNVTNIKIPVAINAMDIAEVKQGTEEGDCITTIASAVSSIVTTAIVCIFVILTIPLTPVFSNPVLAPAFDNVVPALFGGLLIAFLMKDPKVGIPIVILGVALFVAVPALASVYPIVLPILAALSIGLARILYKKGKI